MNKTQSELAHYAWNPVTGCLNDCRYCYTKRSILRFSSDFRRNMTDPGFVKLAGNCLNWTSHGLWITAGS